MEFPVQAQTGPMLNLFFDLQAQEGHAAETSMGRRTPAFQFSTRRDTSAPDIPSRKIYRDRQDLTPELEVMDIDIGYTYNAELAL